MREHDAPDRAEGSGAVGRWEFAADTAVLAEISQKVADYAARAGMSEETAGEIQLAVDEACTNTIKHGLGEDPAQRFELELTARPGELTVRITERGAPFQAEEVPRPDTAAALDERAIGGLGMMFMREMMDRVEHTVGDDGLKTLIMTRKERP